MSRSGYRNGQLIYPVSVVDHNGTLIDPQLESLENDVEELMQWKEEETTVYEDVFYIGGGATYSDVLTDANMVGVKKSMKMNVNVTVTQGQHIIIVIKKPFDAYFSRADINGTEMPFTVTEETVDGEEYAVYTSDDAYNAGTYNLDINS